MVRGFSTIFAVSAKLALWIILWIRVSLIERTERQGCIWAGGHQ
jgi:hypothetical protein